MMMCARPRSMNLRSRSLACLVLRRAYGFAMLKSFEPRKHRPGRRTPNAMKIAGHALLTSTFSRGRQKKRPATANVRTLLRCAQEKFDGIWCSEQTLRREDLFFLHVFGAS